VGTDPIDGAEATLLLNDEPTSTQVVMVSSPPFEEHRFAVPSIPAPKSKPNAPASGESIKTAQPLYNPSITDVQPPTPKNELKRSKSKELSSETTPDRSSLAQQRPPRRGGASSGSPAASRPSIASSGDKIDLSALDDFEPETTPPRKRRADEILPAPSNDDRGESSMPLEEFAKKAVQLKKHKAVELVTIEDGDEAEAETHQLADGAPDIIEIQEDVAKSAEKAQKTSTRDLGKRKRSSDLVSPPVAAVPPRAKQLFDASSDDDADDSNMEEAAAQEESTSDDHVQGPLADYGSALASPPPPQAPHVFAMPQSPPKKLASHVSHMDVVESSIPLPSLAPRDSRFMDMDEASQPLGRITRAKSRQMQQDHVGFGKEVSSMKGVKEMMLPSIPMDEYHAAQIQPVHEEARQMDVVEGGEGLVPHIHLEEDPAPYEGAPVGYEYHDAQFGGGGVVVVAHNDGLLAVEHEQQTLRRSDTLTPSIDLTQIRVTQMIGSGSCGEVYKGTWLGLAVAVKKVFRSLIHESALKEFQAECNIMKRLRHPNIVLFLGITRGGDEPRAGNGMLGVEASKAAQAPSLLSDSLMCLVTEYMPLGSLHDVLMDPKTTIDLMAILKMATDAAKGINYMHMSSPPIIHRDLKSHNLLVGDNFVVKVTDFGLAKLTTSRDDAHNTFCGTLPWAAPEVLSGSGYTVKADVYSFGVVLWELITRQEPYKGLNKPDIIVGVVSNELRPPLFPDMEPLIVELIQVCWAQDPDERPDFQTIVDRLTEVTDYLYALHMERKNKAAMGLANSLSGGELNYSSRWLSLHEPGSLDHHQQVKLAQEALDAGAQPERGELEEVVISASPGFARAALATSGPLTHTSSEEIQKAHHDALELMNSALETGDMNAVFNAMEQVRLAAEGVARLAAQGIGSGAGNGHVNGSTPHALSLGIGNGPSSHSNSLSRSSKLMNASFSSRSKQSSRWALDLNELTSIEKLPEEMGPSFANRVNQSLTKSHESDSPMPSEVKQSNLAMSGTTNVMPPPNDENSSQRAYTAWHGHFRGQDVLVRVWHEALEAIEVREFHKQLNILSEVKSSRVALFYGCVLEPRLLMVTEYTPQPSLYSMMTADASTTRIDWDVVIIIALEIAKAISSLHLWKPAIVHRDIQSSKFVVDPRTWSVKMNDLGLARFDHASNQSTLSKMRGNFLYTAPEAYSGASYSTQSDVYSFGIVLWELVTRCIVGHYIQPFSEFSNIRFEFQLVIQVSKDAIRPSLHPDTPPPLAQLIQDCWAQDPSLRPQIHDVASQLEQLKILYEQETHRAPETMQS
jgi:serine/threonine protein kinase